MKKTLEYFTGNITLESKWDCDLGEITDVYDENGDYVGMIETSIGNINEDNFDELANEYNLNL